MRLLPFLFCEGPILLLLIGAFLGKARLGRALWFLFGMIALAEGLVITSLITADLSYFLAALLVSAFAIVSSVAFSFGTSTPVSPAPVDYAVEAAKQTAVAWNGLAPETKQKVGRAVVWGLKVAAPIVAASLHKKGFKQSAHALKRAATQL